MPNTRHIRGFFIPLLLAILALAATAGYAGEDLNALSGLWVVDYSKTKALWEEAQIDEEKEGLDILAAFFRLDMDFSASTMIEGTSFSKNPTRDPFNTSRNSDGNLLITSTRRGESKTFLWAMRDGGGVSVTVSKNPPIVSQSPPLSMMKCDYSKYAGKWTFDMPANEPLVTMIANSWKDKTVEEIREILANLHLNLSFSNNGFDMRWRDEEGETIYATFPSGIFDVTRYGETACLIGDDDISMSFESDDYIIMAYYDTSLSLKRINE